MKRIIYISPCPRFLNRGKHLPCSLIEKVVSGGVQGDHPIAFPPHTRAFSLVFGIPHSPAHPDEPFPPPHHHFTTHPPLSSPPQESEDAVKALAKEKDLLEREKWELRRQAKEATDHAAALRSQLDLKDNRMKELEAELAMVSPHWALAVEEQPGALRAPEGEGG